MQSNGFVRREKNGIAYYSCLALEQVPGLRHGFSTRHGRVGRLPDRVLNLSYVSWDSPEHVEENRRRFLSALDLRTENLVTLSQIHSDRFHIIKGPPHQWDDSTQGDALVTRSQNVALAVQLADCFPILAADPRTGAIACIHSGWRGTLGRIVLKTLLGMIQAFDCDPAHLIIAVGPGIRSCCMEVDADIAARYDLAFAGAAISRLNPANSGKYFLDLPRALSLQALEAGVPAGNLFDSGLCTRCRPDEFFSYRAEGAGAGRMMAVIGTIPLQSPGWCRGGLPGCED